MEKGDGQPHLEGLLSGLADVMVRSGNVVDRGPRERLAGQLSDLNDDALVLHLRDAAYELAERAKADQTGAPRRGSTRKTKSQEIPYFPQGTVVHGPKAWGVVADGA